MDQFTNERQFATVDRAVAGDREALEELILGVQDMVFNLSLRMLGTFPDAEDAAQDILLKVITHLPSFKKESAFSTWVYRIAVNHLKNYQKHLFAQRPLSFEFYGEDIRNANLQDIPDLTQNVDRAVLAEELKFSCTNVMLQCLDAESRCVFILGTMFELDSRMAGEILGITPEAYRQKLSRSRKKMAAFLQEYCGAYGSGKCSCAERVNYAIQNHRISPERLEHTSAVCIPAATLREVKHAMEELDDLSQSFAFCRAYQTPERLRELIVGLLQSATFSTVQNAWRWDK